MKLIPLSNNRLPNEPARDFSMVDDGDFERVSQFKWVVKTSCTDPNSKYAHRAVAVGGRKFTTQTMHQFITNGEFKKVDHKDRNGLNNQRHNLRVANSIQNGRNRKLNANASIGFKGVRVASKYKAKYEARITFCEQRIGLGCYETAEEAALAYDAAAEFLFKEFAATNKSLGLLPCR